MFRFKHFLRFRIRAQIAFAVAFACPLYAQPTTENHGATADAARLQRLELLTAIWARLSLLHPLGADGSIDWNQELVKAIPLIESAKSAEEIARALNVSLFARLGDPLAFAQRGRERVAPPLSGPVRPPQATRVNDHVVKVDLTDPRAPNAPGFPRQLDRALGIVGPSDTLVLDLRWPAEYSGGGLFREREYWWTILLDSVRSTGPTLTRERLGWLMRAPQPGDWYAQAWRAEPGTQVRPLSDDRATMRESYARDSLVGLVGIRVPAVILVNNGAMRRYERALRTLSYQRNIAIVYQRTGALSEAAKYGIDDSVSIRFHDAVLLDNNGALGWRPDVVTNEEVPDNGIVTAARRALSERGRETHTGRAPFDYRIAAPASWPTSARAPSREERIAGLISLWSVLQRFYPYQDHIRIDFSRDLRVWIRRVESSVDLVTYYRALNELLAGINDGHAFAVHAEVPFRKGNTVPVKIMRVQGKPVVVEVAPSVQADSFPLRLGDEILAIDGRSAAEWEAFYRPVVSAARDPLGFLWAFGFPLQGPPGSLIELTVSGGSARRTVHVARSMQPSESFDTVTVRRLAGGIGYINLRAIGGAALDAAMEEFEQTAPGVILDLRGYLNALGNLPMRVVNRPLSAPRANGGVVRLTIDQDLETLGFAQYRAPEITPDTKVRYRKPIVVMTDGRTGSAAESWSLIMQTAPNVTFVGALTVGTTGGTTLLSLPGGGNARFTGERIVRFDGTSFHGEGIVPHVRAEPTVIGLRHGRDEVLERALSVLREKMSARRPGG